MDVNDPRLPAWTERRDWQDRLALLQVQRAAVCGCTNCGDFKQLDDLAYDIRETQRRIAELSETIMDGAREVPQVVFLVGEAGPELFNV